MSSNYHLRRSEKEFSDPDEINHFLKKQELFTLAMNDGDFPYLVTMDYVFDFESRCFYFHCSSKGRKLDILRKNAHIWGQIVEDLGYIPGECNHGYISLQFNGKVEFIDDEAEKRHALTLMIEKFEENPEPAKKRFITEGAIKGVKIGRILPENLVGKQFIPPN
ncbi:MAG: pyridoxamine 5'-phosphate oxidase family protein [Promethearchaeota archaeon]